MQSEDYNAESVILSALISFVISNEIRTSRARSGNSPVPKQEECLTTASTANCLKRDHLLSATFKQNVPLSFHFVLFQFFFL